MGVLRLIFVLDRGFDDLKLLHLFERLGVCFVVRAQHVERRCRLRPSAPELNLQRAVHVAPVHDQFELRRPVSHSGKTQWRPTQTVARQCQVFIDAGRLRINVVKLDFAVPVDVDGQGWTLFTNLPTGQPGAAGAVVRLYLRRWAVEDVFAWTKQALGWEQVRVLHFDAIRTLVTLAWIAASFVFSLGETLDAPGLQMLAHLGGDLHHNNRSPGKKVLLWGLQRLAAALLLDHHRRDLHLRSRLDALTHSLFGSP